MAKNVVQEIRLKEVAPHLQRHQQPFLARDVVGGEDQVDLAARRFEHAAKMLHVEVRHAPQHRRPRTSNSKHSRVNSSSITSIFSEPPDAVES